MEAIATDAAMLVSCRYFEDFLHGLSKAQETKNGPPAMVEGMHKELGFAACPILQLRLSGT